MGSVLIQVKNSYSQDVDYEKFVVVLVGRMLRDMVRTNFFGVKEGGPPLVFCWEWELLKVGAIEPDSQGMVLYQGTGKRRLMQGADVIAQGEEAVRKIEALKGESH